MTYQEFLKSQGASDEEVKLLATSTAIRAYDAMQAQINSEATARTIAEKAAKTAADEQQRYDHWYQTEALPEYKRMEQESIVSKANEARARAALVAAQQQGLIDVAKDLGYETAPTTTGTPAASPQPGGFDPKNYLTKEQIVAIAEREGEAIAVVADIAAEHARLFPNQSVNFRELRKEAMAQRKSVEQLWMEKYSVQAARDAASKARQDAEQAKWKAEGAKEKETEMVSKYGNPETRPLAPSTSPFAARPSVGRDKQPWELGNEDQLSADRVKRGTQKVISQLQ